MRQKIYTKIWTKKLMDKFGLTENQLYFILKILNDNIKQNNAKYYIFGSRAKGTFKKFSDVDIAVDLNNNKLEPEILAQILINFEDSIFPYKVDIIDLNGIDKKFFDYIKNDLIQIN